MRNREPGVFLTQPTFIGKTGYVGVIVNTENWTAELIFIGNAILRLGWDGEKI